MTSRRLCVAVLAILVAGELAAKEISHSHPIEANGAVRLDIAYGSVRVVAMDTETVRVSGTIDERIQDVSIEMEAGALEIRARYSWLARLRMLNDGPSLYRADLVVQVPSDTRLFVVSRSADVEIDGVAGPIGVGVVSSTVIIRGRPASVDFEAISGGLEFTGSTPRLRASTLTGTVRATGSADRLELEAASGSLELRGLRLRDARLTTVSGDIGVAGSVVDGGRLEARSDSGEVKLACFATATAQLDLESRNGEILNEVTDARPETLGNGARSLELDLADGSGSWTATVRTRSGLIWLLPTDERNN